MEELINIAEGKTEFSWDGITTPWMAKNYSSACIGRPAPRFEGSLKMYWFQIMDVTERKQSEDQIRQFERQPGTARGRADPPVERSPGAVGASRELATRWAAAPVAWVTNCATRSVSSTALFYYLKLFSRIADEKDQEIPHIIDRR